MTSSPSAFATLDHEQYMRAAIEEGRRNRAWPFGAVIVNQDSGEIMARGFNQANRNITFHGEIVALNTYIDAHGHANLPSRVLYTTAEPCPMCMGALIWAGIGGVVFGTSVEGLVQAGIRQITIGSLQMCAQADFYDGQILGGVLSDETDALFRDRTLTA